MNILLVEDRATEVAAICAILHPLGHTVVVCAGGDMALLQFLQQQPDVVITAAFVPGLDGFALTQAIQQRTVPRWQPVIVIASECDESLQARAIEAGADSFLVTPVSPAVLTARLAAIERLLNLQRDADARMTQLSRFLAAEEEDLQIARHLIAHQMSPEGVRRLEDPAIEVWQQTCPRLGGNMVSVNRGPDGVLHAMLADASGYGLSACVSLLPLISPFYRMTAKGCSLQTIVRELNAKVRQALPEHRTVAAQLVAVDLREGVVSVWNGGMPTAFMLDGFGHHFMEFPLTHPPFGTTADADFDDRIEQHAFSRGEQLVLVTDGLLEAAGPPGKRFGVEGLAAALVGLPRSQRRNELMAAIDVHLAGEAPDDDMTLLLIDCEKQAMPAPVAPAPPMGPRHHGHWHVELQLGANELGRIDVVPLLLEVVGRFETTQSRSGELFVILSELYNNALDHGILRMDSRIKHSHDGLETWLLQREERLAALQHGEIRIVVAQTNEGGRLWLRMHCRDSGPGFDVASALARLAHQPQAPVNEHYYGRGLALIQHMAERITFNESGNEATVLLAVGNT
jgi:serine phosphatase RsbU (regulator of sigma subunit)/anti-sigma regulatory factor (Ser/Thr protein kinase)